MEDPLLSKSDNGENSSSNEEHIVDMSAEEQTPNEEHVVYMNHNDQTVPYEAECDQYVYNLIDLVLNLIQIVAAIVVMIRAKDKEPQVWIIAYTCGCIAILPILCWRFWYYSQRFSSYSNRSIETRMEFWKKVFDYYFVVWVIFVVLYLTENLSSLDNTTQHFWLCMAFLGFSFIRYVIPNLLCAALGLCFVSRVVIDTITDILQYILRIVIFICCRCCYGPMELQYLLYQ